MPDFVQEARLNELALCSSFYLLECAKYSGGKKIGGIVI